MHNCSTAVLTRSSSGTFYTYLYTTDGNDVHLKDIFIDEAGHSTEPEVLACLSGIMGADTRVILAGDPKQLGPIVRSPIAKTFKHDVSLLERLSSTMPMYQPDSSNRYNNACIFLYHT
jgi:superfamily I DNA and/or RNA helicase